MGGRRGILQHRHVAEVAARHARVGAQSLDAQLGESEALYLRNVDRRIEVEQVGGRAVGLVAHQHAVAVGPADPLLCEVLVEQVAERLAIVGQHLVAVVLQSQQFVQVFAEVVAAPFLKLVEERGCPVGAIHLIGVVEESVGVGDARRCKGFLEALQIVLHGLAVEVVYHPSLATRGGALHLLHGAAQLHADVVLSVGGYAVVEDGLAGSLLHRHEGTAEGPSRATVHIHLDAFLLRDGLHVAQGVHPFGREKPQLVLLVALYAIEWGNLHGADARLGIFAEVPFQSLAVYGRPHPPPARAGLGFGQWCGPCL